MKTNQLSNEQLLQGFTREIQQLHQQGMAIRLRLEPQRALALIGALQLACRHPGFSGTSRKIVEGLVQEMEDTFAKYDVPFTVEVIHRGWNQKHDE